MSHNPATRDRRGRIQQWFVRTIAMLIAVLLLGESAMTYQAPKSASAAQKRKAAREPKEKPEPKKKTSKPDKKTDDADAADEHKDLKELRNEQKLPRLSELAVPTVSQLIQRPVDWLVLKGVSKTDGFVLVVKPVFPRPETLKKLAAALDDLRKRMHPTTPEERAKYDAQRNDLLKLMVTLPDDATGQLYDVPLNVIDHFVYHEDLVIQRAGLLVDDKKFRDAFELLYPLERSVPSWPGLEDQIRRLIYAEAEAALSSGDYQSAFTSLAELHSRDREYPGLQARLGEVTDKLIETARTAHDYREARHFLARLVRIEPKHPTAVKWRQSLLAEADQLITSAQQSFGRSQYAEAAEIVDHAARIWPTAPRLREAHRRICDRYQRLEVGALALPGDSQKLPYRTLADSRATRLEQFNLFQVDRVDDATHYRSRLLEQWEPTDLGRQAVFTLRSTRSRWESRPAITAGSVMATMRAMIDPQSPAFDERLGNYLEAIQLRSPLELELRFRHAPPRMEPLFRFPIASSGRASAAESSNTVPELGPVLSRRFERTAQTPSTVVFRRLISQPNGLDQYQTAEVNERRYASVPLEIQALLRGDVSMLLDLPPWAITPLRRDTRFFLLDYAIPTTHVLQINPRSTPLKSRELRLALSYSIDTSRILTRRILRDPESTAGRPSTAPFATTSYAYNGLVARRDFNPNMAFSLREAAVKRLQANPKLKLLCEHDPEARMAADELITQWKRIGLQVEIVNPEALSGKPKSTNEPPEWDLAYRKLRMEEPIVELWPFLTVRSQARLEDLRELPDWLRIELLDLDNATDWKSAVGRLQNLHAHLYAEVSFIPLWEVDDTIVLRKNVHDFPAHKFITAYQDIERWVIQSWYPEDEP